MKLHISYNVADIAQALALAEQTAPHADILGIGSLLLMRYGVQAVAEFRKKFPEKELFAEARLTEKVRDIIPLFAQAGASYVSVLAGSFASTIKKATESGKVHGVKIALDLLDAASPGQSAFDAQSMGVNLLVVHRAPLQNGMGDIVSEWPSIRDNTKLPILITGKIDESNIKSLVDLKPLGLMIGAAITHAQDPAAKALQFKNLL